MAGSAYDNTDYHGYLRKAMENEANLQDPKYKNDLKKEFIKEPPVRLDLDELDRTINKHVRHIHDLIDAACRVSLESKTKGVKVTTHWDGVGKVTVEVSDEIPFGQIHYFHDDGHLYAQVLNLPDIYPDTHGR